MPWWGRILRSHARIVTSQWPMPPRKRHGNITSLNRLVQRAMPILIERPMERLKEGCETCHNVRQWKELRSFDHSTTKFPIEGAHQTVQCVGCHKPGPTQNSKSRVPDFFRTPVQCSGCHEDVHGGQFLSGGAEKDCVSCHTISKWDAAAFDHDKTAFALSGAHDKVRCRQCHTQLIESEGRQIRWYRGTPTTCKGCHGN